MAIEQKSKQEIVSAYNRARGTIAKAKKETKAITGRTVNTALSVGAGAGVGVLHAKFADAEGKLVIPGTAIEGDLALGVVGALAGIAGIADEYSESLCAISSGVLAGHMAIRMKERGAN